MTSIERIRDAHPNFAYIYHALMVSSTLTSQMEIDTELNQTRYFAKYRVNRPLHCDSMDRTTVTNMVERCGGLIHLAVLHCERESCFRRPFVRARRSLRKVSL